MKSQKFSQCTNRMQGWYLFHILLGLILAFILFVIFAPFFLDGNIYHMDNPVTVDTDGLHLFTSVNRVSRITTSAINYPRLNCGDLQYQYKPRLGSIEKGETVVYDMLEIPKDHTGECTLTGFVEYNLIPNILTLHFEYYSEPFVIPSADLPSCE